MRRVTRSTSCKSVQVRHGTGSLGHRVNGSFGSSFTFGSPGHRVIILIRCEFRVFPVLKKCPKFKTYMWNAEKTKSHCQVSLVGLKSLDGSPCNELLLLPMIIKNSLAWEYFFTHKSTFGVHYRTGSPGQLGLRVARFPGHWVAGSQNVTSSISGSGQFGSVQFKCCEQTLSNCAAVTWPRRLDNIEISWSVVSAVAIFVRWRWRRSPCRCRRN